MDARAVFVTLPALAAHGLLPYAFVPVRRERARRRSGAVAGATLLLAALACAPVLPRLDVTPTTLDFGYLTVGSVGGPLAVAVTNVGTTPASGFGPGTPSDAAFAVVSSRTAVLAPGDACRYDDTFTPMITAVVEATATLATPAGSFDVVLRGAAAASQSVSALELDFGDVGVGATSPVQTVVIRNHGTTTLDGFAGGAPFDPQFLASQTSAAGVAPGGSCQYFFAFAPDTEGVFTSTTSSSTNGGPVIVELHGTGVGARVWATPLELDFGEVGVGLTSDRLSVTIKNLGKATLAGFSGGAPGAPFTAIQNCAGGVAPGASCAYTFCFAPTEAGVFSGISSSGSSGGAISIALRGHTPPP